MGQSRAADGVVHIRVLLHVSDGPVRRRRQVGIVVVESVSAVTTPL